MKIDSALKIGGSLMIIGGAIGFMTSTNYVLGSLGLFLAGLTILLVSGVFDNARKLDDWVEKRWGANGQKR